jgi:photosystem I P700 chlorophyll a apoprotein A1
VEEVTGKSYLNQLFGHIYKLKVAPTIQPRALSITQGRAVGVTHFLVGGIATTWAFFHARLFGIG